MDHALICLVYATTVFLTALEALILWKMATDKLDLRRLIANDNGDASLSRVQLLVFTFVIAAGFLYLTAKGSTFPVVSNGVLVLLGISGATYAIGKSLDKPATSQTAATAKAPTSSPVVAPPAQRPTEARPS